MIICTPTIHFNGRCEEAIHLYQEAFKAKIGCLLHYSDRNKSDWDLPLTGEQENYVYHSEILIGEQRIMMADNHEPDPNKNTSMFLTITFDCAEEVKGAYEVLKEGSTIIVPMHSTTYSSCMVSLIDKFGIRWGLMTEQTDR